jgi:quercetin dioxygenase-like cupin family protein
MNVKHSESVPEQAVDMEGAQGCRVRWLMGESDGAPTFAMRQFVIEPGGHTPKHHHPYEHEVYVLDGDGVVVEGDTEHAICGGDVILVVPDEVHQFRNTGSQPMRFLCLIPNDAAGKKVTVAPECGVQSPNS